MSTSSGESWQLFFFLLLREKGFEHKCPNQRKYTQSAILKFCYLFDPYQVLSIVSNPCTDEYLAVQGLKDCHVLTFGSGGSVSDHLVLHPQLESNNYIIKTAWMPGSQTELAIVTADFIKVYDLGSDVLSPQFYFLVPSGKVRDSTLAIFDDSKYVIIMSTAGHIYFQCLNQVWSPTQLFSVSFL